MLTCAKAAEFDTCLLDDTIDDRFMGNQDVLDRTRAGSYSPTADSRSFTLDTSYISHIGTCISETS